MINKKIISFLILFFLVFTLYGFDFESYGVTGGVMYIENSSTDGAPSPILPYLGANASFYLKEKMFIEPTIAFNWNYYLWSTKEGMALPAEIEYADSVLLLNIIIDCPFVMKYDFKKNLSLCWLASPLFIFRVPLKTWGEGESQKSDIMSYFYGGRFLFLEAGGFAEWDFSSKNSLKARVDLILPVFHLWDGDSFSDQLSVRVSVTFSFMSEKAQQRKAAAKTASTETTKEKSTE